MMFLNIVIADGAQDQLVRLEAHAEDDRSSLWGCMVLLWSSHTALASWNAQRRAIVDRQYQKPERAAACGPSACSDYPPIIIWGWERHAERL